MLTLAGSIAEADRQTDGYRLPVAAIYLDYHATTPVDRRVAQVVLDAMVTTFGNANSVDHRFGSDAAALVLDARGSVAELVGAEADDVRFTSGATEAISIALRMAKADCPDRPLRIALSCAEHKAMIEAARLMEGAGLATLRWLGVDQRGRTALAELVEALRDGSDLLCLMAANNEVGTINPIEAAAGVAAQAGVAILVDATQAAGRLPIDVGSWGVDYLVLSAHKIYGPKGVGALVARGSNRISAAVIGGHEGTANVPGIAGMGEACRLRLVERDEDEPRIEALRDRLEAALLAQVPDLMINGDVANRLGHNLHVSALGADNGAVTATLHRSVAISTGSACTSGAQEASHVLRAMSLAPELQESALRISPGKFTTTDEVDCAAAAIAAAIRQVRAARGAP
jgi:cysteine desulfurase